MLCYHFKFLLVQEMQLEHDLKHKNELARIYFEEDIRSYSSNGSKECVWIFNQIYFFFSTKLHLNFTFTILFLNLNRHLVDRMTIRQYTFFGSLSWITDWLVSLKSLKDLDFVLDFYQLWWWQEYSSNLFFSVLF